MKLWTWWIILLILICFLSIIESSKNRRKVHRRHRHSNKHHRHNQKNKLSIRKKRSQLDEKLNHTLSANPIIDSTKILPAVNSTYQYNQEYNDLEKIFGRIEEKHVTSTTLKNFDTIKNHLKKRQFFNSTSSDVLSDLSRLFGQNISQNYKSDDTILPRKKRQINENFGFDSLYDDSNSMDIRQRRFADTKNDLNDENSLYKNSLEDVYPEAVGDFEYYLPLAKLIRTKRLDVSSETKNNNLTKLNYEKSNNYSNSDDKKNKRNLDIKNIQTRSVKEVKRLAKKLIAKVNELENSFEHSHDSAKLQQQINPSDKSVKIPSMQLNQVKS